MNKRFYLLMATLAILALALSACVDEAANPADVDYWPWNWGNRTLESTLADKCDGLPTGSSVAVNGNQVPCPEETQTTEAPDYQGEAAPYAVTAANGWPIDFGENRTMTVQAPKDQDLVVNYGREGFNTAGQQVQICGTALVSAGYTLDLVFWAGNAESVSAGYGAEYAQFTYANRHDAKNGDSRCQAWETFGFTALATDAKP